LGKQKPRSAVPGACFIVRSSDAFDDAKLYAFRIRETFPAQAALVGPRNTYELLDFFDEYDIQIQGRQYLETVLHCLHHHNQVVIGFVISWSHEQTKEKFESLLKPTNILEVFGDKLLAKHGEDFLTSALAHIRHSLRMVRRSQELSGTVEPQIKSLNVLDSKGGPIPESCEPSVQAPCRVSDQVKIFPTETVIASSPSLMDRGSVAVSPASGQSMLAPTDPTTSTHSSLQHNQNRRMVSAPVGTMAYNGFGVQMQDRNSRHPSQSQIIPTHMPQHGSSAETPAMGQAPPHVPTTSHPPVRTTVFNDYHSMSPRQSSNVVYNPPGHFPGTPRLIGVAPGPNPMGMANPPAAAYPLPHAQLPPHLAGQLPARNYNVSAHHSIGR